MRGFLTTIVMLLGIAGSASAFDNYPDPYGAAPPDYDAPYQYNRQMNETGYEDYVQYAVLNSDPAQLNAWTIHLADRNSPATRD